MIPAGSQSPHSMRTVRVLVKFIASIRLVALRQPHGMAAAGRVFDDMVDDGEAVVTQQSTVFLRIEAAMIERLALEAADGIAVARTAGEQKRRAGLCVRAEDRKHGALIVGC